MKSILFGIFGIVLISLVSVVYFDSTTGAVSSSSGYYSANTVYGINKMYSGSYRKALTSTPNALGQAYAAEVLNAKVNNMFAQNQDRLVCGFGDEAIESSIPCYFSESKNSYCCLENK